MTELFVMTRYLRPDLLKQAGIERFDDWAANFGEVVSQLEIKPAGDGFRTKKRFAKFVNLPELMSIYKEFADIQTADMLNLPVPELKGGKPTIVVAKPSEFQKEYMQILAQRSERVHSGSVDPHEDNMLKITHEARLLGLDGRTINPKLQSEPNGKVNLCIEKVMQIYNGTSEQKGVQAIFCDIAVNSDGGKFSVYETIKEELVERGIPRDEICFASDANNTKQRGELFAKIRNGDKRIVIASTSKMGTGANIQTRLAALHHLDIPWRPSYLEQRNGRILRQGNDFSEVEIFNYVTENTFDAYMLNIVTTKQKFISQLLNSESTVRTCDDVDDVVLTYSEMQALATGDPRVKERIELSNKITELRTLESAHNAGIYKMQDALRNLPADIEDTKSKLDSAKLDKELSSKFSGEFSIELFGRTYERKEAEDIILKELLRAKVGNSEKSESKILGSYKGFEFAIRTYTLLGETQTCLCLSNNLTYECSAGTTENSRNTMRLENLVSSGIEQRIEQLNARLDQLSNDFEVAKNNVAAPFARADELMAAVRRMAELDEIFSNPDDVIADDNDKQKVCETENEVKNSKPDKGKSKLKL